MYGRIDDVKICDLKQACCGICQLLFFYTSSDKLPPFHSALPIDQVIIIISSSFLKVSSPITPITPPPCNSGMHPNPYVMLCGRGLPENRHAKVIFYRSQRGIFSRLVDIERAYDNHFHIF